MISTHILKGLLSEQTYLRVWMVGVFSGIARWLEMLVVGVYTYDTTGSPFLVALLVILRMLPLAVLGSVVGTLADRASPRKLLIITMTTAMIISFSVFFALV